MPQQLTPAQVAIGQAVSDAAARFPGLDAAAWTANAQPVTWNDSSLGLPEPGYGYAQALVRGFRVVLTQGSTTAVYHCGNGRAVYADPARFPWVNQAPRERGQGGAAALGF